jgi:hypothetical protein
LFINQGDGTFEIKSLPLESQFSPVYAVEVQDFNADGNPDILLGGIYTGPNPRWAFTRHPMALSSRVMAKAISGQYLPFIQD